MLYLQADLILKQCETIIFDEKLSDIPFLKALTFNNWGCLYRRGN